MEVRVDALVHARQLQRRLRVAVDALHLRVAREAHRRPGRGLDERFKSSEINGNQWKSYENTVKEHGKWLKNDEQQRKNGSESIENQLNTMRKHVK